MPCGVALSKRGYNMKRNIKEKAIHYSKIIATEKKFTLFIILTLVLIPLGEIATLVHNEYFVSQPVIVDFAGWVGSIMAVAYFIANRKKYYPSDFFLFTLFVFAVISSTFSHDRNQTLFGFYYDEWFIHYMAYFALMFAATNVKKLKYKEYILAAFVTVTAINIVPSVLESVGAWPYYAYFGAESHEENKWVYGLTQNSNFYAGISTVFTACCTMLFLFAKSKKDVHYTIYSRPPVLLLFHINRHKNIVGRQHLLYDICCDTYISSAQKREVKIGIEMSFEALRTCFGGIWRDILYSC